MSDTSFRDTPAGKVFDFIIGREKKKHSHGDPSREVFETIVFVVVLVLMLKLFVAEAFVIPTGSMASTLWGDQIVAKCPECGARFPVTASPDQRAAHKRRNEDGAEVVMPWTTYCQNCGLKFAVPNSFDWNTGDRVLVGKYAYHVGDPRRFDVVVFKYPKAPYDDEQKTAMNYIKRLIGLPGETIAIYKGDLYRTTKLTYPGKAPPDDTKNLWKIGYTYEDDPEALALFAAGGFEPIRKSPDEILTVRRLVFDLDKAPKDLSRVFKTRWHPSPEAGAGWAGDETGFAHTGSAEGWIRYHHVQPGSWDVDGRTGRVLWRWVDEVADPRDPDHKRRVYAWRPEMPSPAPQPAEIRDHLAYNVHLESYSPESADLTHEQYWVPDLIVECTAEFADPAASLSLELTKAGDRFRARFENGVCQVSRIPAGAPDRPEVLAEQKTGIKGGRYALRFANVDSRLTVWVDGRPLDFGGKTDYEPPNRKSFDPTTTDIYEPARIGSTGGVAVSHVSLWRDVYYTCYNGPGCSVKTYYVHPGHYMCLGDNSSSSKDSRDWGMVPERLMLGKAVVVYWPGSWELVGFVVAVIAAFAFGYLTVPLVARSAYKKESPSQLAQAAALAAGLVLAAVVGLLLYHYWQGFDPGRVGVIK